MFDEFLCLLNVNMDDSLFLLAPCNRCWAWEVRTNNIHKGFVEMGVS